MEGSEGRVRAVYIGVGRMTVYEDDWACLLTHCGRLTCSERC